MTSVLHLIWLGGEPPSSCLRYAKGFDCFAARRVWLDVDLAASKAGWVTRTRWYERAIVERPLAAKDMARLAILDAYGGVYSDWDVEWLRPISATGEWPRTDGKALVGYEDDRWLCNAVIAAPPGHDAIRRLLGAYAAASYDSPTDREGLRGPPALTGAMHACPDQFTALSPEVFYPLHWATREMRRTERTVAIHWYDDSPHATHATQRTL